MKAVPIPTPSKVLGATLAKLPPRLRDVAVSLLSLAQWIGLPATLISFFVDRAWIVDAARWLYERAGLVQHLLLLLAQACTLVAQGWRWLTDPVRLAVANLIGFDIPAWVVDLTSILLLLVAGQVRAHLVMRANERAWMTEIMNRSGSSNDEIRTQALRRFKEVFKRMETNRSDSVIPALRADVRRHPKMTMEETIELAQAKYSKLLDGSPSAEATLMFAAVYLHTRESMRRRAIFVALIYSCAAALMAIVLFIEWRWPQVG